MYIHGFILVVLEVHIPAVLEPEVLVYIPAVLEEQIVENKMVDNYLQVHNVSDTYNIG